MVERGGRETYYLAPEEADKREEYAKLYPSDPEKYLRFLKLVARYDYQRTLNGLHTSDEWAKRGQWGTFTKMGQYARARRAVGLRRAPNGDELLGRGETFDTELRVFQIVVGGVRADSY